MQILSRDDLRHLAPSIFTRSPYHTMTPKYRVAITADVVDSLERNGIFPVHAQQSCSRATDRRAFVKHLIRFRRSEDIDANVAAEIPEVVLTNSFDGTSAYRLNAGLFRVACLNGLVCPTGELGGVSVRHSGDDIDQRIVDATYRVVTESVKALDTVKEWKQITLTPALQLEMAVHAMGLKPNASIRAELLLAARREADQPDRDGNRSLWVAMNTLEENMIRGGIKGVNERGRRISTKAIRQIDLDFKIHRGLWELARQYAEMN
jgi:hypothetical protein